MNGESALANGNPPTPPHSYSRTNLSRSPPADRVQKLTPLEGEVLVADDFPFEGYGSAYDRVCALLESLDASLSGRELSESLDFSKPMSIRMPLRDFIKLDENIPYEHGYPQYEYDPRVSTLVVRCKPSPIRETFISEFITAFAMVEVSLPLDFPWRISIIGKPFFMFRGKYSGITKNPAIAVTFLDGDGIARPRFVLEVGITETYEQMTGDAQKWLEGYPGTSVVVLVKLEETPEYRNPIHGLSEEELEEFGLPSREEIKATDFTMDGLGQVVFKELTWVGSISGFLEVWRRHPNTGLAVRCGARMDVLADPPLHFKLSEFVPIAPQDERTAKIDWERCRGNLQSSMRALAASRCREAISSNETGGEVYVS
ncbi:MAG: hypothetical protein M1839_002174 [Geoglossum umbratile]|nr:MAG: hypothetical protein M1839_002174 [Geoglossum umbratile]